MFSHFVSYNCNFMLLQNFMKYACMQKCYFMCYRLLPFIEVKLGQESPIYLKQLILGLNSMHYRYNISFNCFG